MSEHPVEAPDAPATSTQAERAAEYVREIMAKDVDERARQEVVKRKGRIRPLLVSVAVAFLLTLTTWNVLRAINPPPVFSADEQMNAARIEVYLLVQQIEDWRREKGAPPASLADLGEEDSGFHYEVSASRYSLFTDVNGTELVFHAEDPIGVYAAAQNTLTGITPGVGAGR